MSFIAIDMYAIEASKLFWLDLMYVSNLGFLSLS